RFFGDEIGPQTRKFELENVMGTADYLPPEQAVANGTVDIRGDIYSLGVTFYFLLTGRSPYQDGSLSQKLMYHQISEPTPVTEHRPEVPRRLVAILETMLAKAPNLRYQEPAELALALSPWDSGPHIPDEQELPQLSLAARNGRSSTGRLPKIAPAPSVQAGTPVRPPLWSRWKERLKDSYRRNPRVQIAIVAGVVAAAAISGAAAAVLAAH
ncbi:MAG TPA: hypothetical protein VGZ47_16210, partial [Gemmataceae bacterium]|nr:hypothetical protein [Gemmataceae bacterium]